MLRADRFQTFADRKMRDAERAAIHRLVTIEDRSGSYALDSIGSRWTRALYDGPFHVPRVPLDSDLPAISLVFVRSSDGNTGAEDPAELGGGATDKHFIYEGLSRVAADAVLAGATSAAGDRVFFSVWHPEFIALRASLALPRHPLQVVLTRRARIDPDRSLLFNVPDVKVIVIASLPACNSLTPAVVSRPWVHLVPLEGGDIAAALRRLRCDFGIKRLSCTGGRKTATALLDAGLVQDLLLTTTERIGGEPNTPFYVGHNPPRLEPIVRKRGTDPDARFVFDHLRVCRAEL